MSFSLVKSNKGIATTASVTPGFATATTSGNLIVLHFAADDYAASPGSGWTQSAGMSQQTFHGEYLWWRISAGETNFSPYVIGSATNSAWVIEEFAGNDPSSPYDTSAGQLAATSGQSYTTTTITPSAGDRLLVAAIGGSDSILTDDLSTDEVSWLNSFTHIASSGPGASVGSGTRDKVGAAYIEVTANGSTTYSSGSTYDSGGSITMQSRTGLIIAFKAAASGALTTNGIASGAAALGSPSLAYVAPFTATNLASGADGLDKPALIAFTAIWVNTWVLDNGLLGLKANADSIYICSQQPADFTGATSTYALGSFSFGVGSVFGAPTNGSPNGRAVTSSSITNGSVSGSGTPTYWAVVDTANSRLLATGPLSGGVAVTPGRQFTLSAVSVQLPSQ